MNHKNNSDDTVLINGKKKSRSTILLKDKAVLVVLSSNFFGESFIIDKKETLIGRNKNCDVVIQDPMISNQHCRICVDEDNKFFISDSGSSNYTYVNKKSIEKDFQLHYGDRIVLGHTVMRFFLEEETEAE